MLARFNNDSPAVTINKFGKGQAIYFGTHPDVGYLENKSQLLYDVLSDFLGKENIKPAVELEYTNRNIKEIDVHYLSNEKEGVFIITNYVNKTQSGFFVNNEKKVRISINVDKKYVKAINLVSNAVIDLVNNSDILEVTIKKNETIILKLTEEWND